MIINNNNNRWVEETSFSFTKIVNIQLIKNFLFF